MGENNCESCKKFHQMCCCRHVFERRLGFFKRLDHDFSSSLALDHKELLEELNSETLNNVIQLKGPTGQPYHIRIDKRGESVVLKNGWKEFVCSHNLQTNDMLFFLYEGWFNFTVYICDKNGEAKSLKRGRDEHLKEQAYLCEVEISDSLDICSDNRNTREKKQDTGGSSSNNSFARRRAKCIFISRREPVTYLQKQDTLARAGKFQSANPCFTKTMLATGVYRIFYLVVPIEFSRRNIPTVKSTVSLVLPHNKKKWNVTCSYSIYTTAGKNKQPLCRFIGGWSNFAFDNNLEEGDVCVFEMKAKLELTVHIFRVVEKIVKLQKANSN